MNKPDWKDAPEWANWLAQDQNGSWWWYESEPKIISDRERSWWRGSGRTISVALLDSVGPKEQRPKPKVETRTITMGPQSFWDAPDGQRIDGPCSITITVSHTQGGGS